MDSFSAPLAPARPSAAQQVAGPRWPARPCAAKEDKSGQCVTQATGQAVMSERAACEQSAGLQMRPSSALPASWPGSNEPPARPNLISRLPLPLGRAGAQGAFARLVGWRPAESSKPANCAWSKRRAQSDSGAHTSADHKSHSRSSLPQAGKLAPTPLSGCARLDGGTNPAFASNGPARAPARSSSSNSHTSDKTNRQTSGRRPLAAVAAAAAAARFGQDNAPLSSGRLMALGRRAPRVCGPLERASESTVCEQPARRRP